MSSLLARRRASSRPASADFVQKGEKGTLFIVERANRAGLQHFRSFYFKGCLFSDFVNRLFTPCLSILKRCWRGPGNAFPSLREKMRIMWQLLNHKNTLTPGTNESAVEPVGMRSWRHERIKEKDKKNSEAFKAGLGFLSGKWTTFPRACLELMLCSGSFSVIPLSFISVYLNLDSVALCGFIPETTEAHICFH